MSERDPVLEFRGVTLGDGAGGDAGLQEASFELRTGDLMLVLVEEGRAGPLLADAALGLTAPEKGAVLFRGQDWTAMSPDAAAAARARIGVAREVEGWISNLDVDENVFLARLHHSKASRPEIEAAGRRLAQRFGLAELPRKRRPWVPPLDLRRAAWVRAFLSEPDLLILEKPGHAAAPGVVQPLLDAVNEALGRGAAAVITTTGGEGLWRDPVLRPRLRCSVHGSKLVSHTEAAP